jgi:DNA-binding MarR family transcriptional regulator
MMPTRKQGSQLLGLVAVVDAFDLALSSAIADSSSAIDREQWRALVLLSDGEGHSMRELSSHVAVPAATATRLVDRLVADSLAYRRGDPLDRRRVLVFATSQGHMAVERVTEQLQSKTLEALGTLSDEQRSSLTTLFDRMGLVSPSDSKEPGLAIA